MVHLGRSARVARLVRIVSVAALNVAWLAAAVAAEDPSVAHEVHLGDPALRGSLRHQQQWGDFGIDAAAAATGNKGLPLKIADRTFERGLGHHAQGEITVALNGRYVEFRTWIGVQWMGGGKGSVRFRVDVDGTPVFESETMSDSDPAREARVPIAGAREMRLVALDCGDGISCDMANWAEARLVRDPAAPYFDNPAATLSGAPAPPAGASVADFALIAADTGPQIAVMESIAAFTADVRPGEDVRVVVPARQCATPFRVDARVSLAFGSAADVTLRVGDQTVTRALRQGETATVRCESPGAEACDIELITRGVENEAAVRWSELTFTRKDHPAIPVPLGWNKEEIRFPARELPALRPAIESALVEWDWRMQDGIGTAREARSWPQAIETILDQGDKLLGSLAAAGSPHDAIGRDWNALREEWRSRSGEGTVDDARWEDLWRRTRWTKRRMAFGHPLAQVGPIAFVKQVPGNFSHQLTQYFGMCARPGGGLFVLDAPGRSMQCRRLGELPPGSYQQPDVSWDGKRILFAYCETDSAPADRVSRQDRKYHIHEISADGTGLRRLTDGPHDDFSPRYLPDGKILFISTRRGGFHRCGAGPCPVYTMATADADGSNVRVISFHETHEWDPAVLHDGRIVYTRWDYVDRNAVHYQHLWTARPDGSDVRSFYGNNTFNPVGIWESRPVPGSHRVMATAAAHHAMTAGSIILLDVSRGIDGLDAITRLTPDALFPESESPVQNWHAPVGVTSRPDPPEAERRWPGHCYRSPFPLSETHFLAAYSFAPLVGEPLANEPNMFGVYLVDTFGNKELIYRDLNIASLWPIPLRPTPAPPALASLLDASTPDEGTFFVQNVYESWPKLPINTPIKSLRIVQVLPKTTPNANSPRVGLANASPGKQVLGTVPVEPDGSAYFRAPSGIPLSFQVLDDRGMAVQTMRSLTYLQPGEQSSCIGCHEYRNTVPLARVAPLARDRPPSVIKEGPDGSKPLSYPLLVQPVLDKHCVECHSGSEAAGKVVLTGTPEGEFTTSYHALAPRVAFSQWSGSPQSNGEPLTRPDRFGARASPLMKMLLDGHEGVELSPDDFERLATWMDANALFYGTFDVEDQKRQQAGQRIAGPALE